MEQLLNRYFEFENNKTNQHERHIGDKGEYHQKEQYTRLGLTRRG